MKCPQCGGELEYPEHAYFNMYDYHNSCIVKTECCGKAVRLIPRMLVESVSVQGVQEDDWGNEIDE